MPLGPFYCDFNNTGCVTQSAFTGLVMETIKLTESEIPLVAKWNVQLHEDEASKPIEIAAAEERHRRWLQLGTYKGAIFNVNGISMGYVIYEHRKVNPDYRDSESLYIRQFFIAREFRRKGYGTKAFRSILENIVSDNTSVKLNVKSSNPSGQQFWESVGFKPENIEYELLRS